MRLFKLKQRSLIDPFALLSALFVLGFTFVSLSYAQNILKFSTTEDIAIAFYKTGRAVPNFERWIKERDPYKHTQPARRPAVMEAELLRLKSAYKAYNPKKDFINIRSYVNLTPQEHTDKKGEKTYTLPMTFKNAPDALYFPYDFMDQRIVVFPINLEKHMNSAISKAQYGFLKNNNNNNGAQTLIMRLRSNKADLSQPYEIDGLSQWALTADIVSMEVWDKNRRLLWEYTEQGYIAPEHQKLNRLYDDRPLETNEKGSIKSLDTVPLNWGN